MGTDTSTPDADPAGPPGAEVPADLLAILACPVDKGPLLYFPDRALLYNPRRRSAYRVDDGIPVMLVDEASVVDDAEHDRLLARAEAEGITPTFTPADGA
ncbi:MAG: Trm112 family protein [Acidimicrobiales bacterium]